MTKKLSLEISEDTYKQLLELGKFYNQDTNQALAAILNAVGRHQSNITSLNSQYGQTGGLETTLSNALSRYPALFHLVSELLEKVEARGHFDIDTDIEFSFDGDYFRICFDAGYGNPSCIHRIDFLKQDGLYCFSTNTYIDSKETTESSLEKLASIIPDISDPFDCESFNIEVDEGFEVPEESSIWTLTIDCWDDCLDALPKMEQVDKLIKKIFKSAKIILKK